MNVENVVSGCDISLTTIVNGDFEAPDAFAAANDQFDCVTFEVSLDGTNSATGPTISYEWSTVSGVIESGQNALNPIVSAPGDYTLLVTDNGNGCTSSSVVTVTANIDSPTIAGVQVIDPNCFGENNGSITLDNITGGQVPYLYSIDGGALAPINQFSFLGAGEYEILVQDANGCESAGADSVTVIINGNPSITLVTSDSASACNTSDGWIEITAAGGDGVYSYSVNGGTSTTANDSITGLAPGNYTPYVVDGNGCSDMASVVTINAPGQPLQPSVVAGNNGVYCQGDAYAALEVVDTISGQTFNWYYDAALTSLYMSGDSVMPADSAGTLTYYVTANASGCQGPSATATVTINPVPVAPTGGNDLTYCLGQPVGNVSGTPNSGGTF